MTYNFDEIIDRRNTNSENVEGWRPYIFHCGPERVFPYKDEEFIRMWVADMEFAVAPEILQAITDRVDRRILGYTLVYDKGYYEALRAWCESRYGWSFPKEQLTFSPGVIPALYQLTEDLVKPLNGKVLTMTPAYGFFLHACEYNGVELVTSPLREENGRFSVDAWAVQNGCAIASLPLAKAVSAAVLEGDVPFLSDFPVVTDLPRGLAPGDAGALGVYVGVYEKTPFAKTLRLVPRVVRLGIGCRKGTDEETIRAAVNEALAAHGIDRRAVKCAASIDLKAEEAGLLAYCRSEGLSAEFYTADELRAVRGEFTPSEFVKSITGVDNVCERAALRNAETLLVKKTARSGVTVAAAAEHWEVRFA